MARVFRARDNSLGRDVALKRIHLDDPQARSSALGEARVLASMHHPHIVTVYDIITDGDDVIIVMEFLTGRTLQALCRNNPLDYTHFLEVAGQTLDGLCAAHANRVLHCDLKPGNIMVRESVQGELQIKLFDFGLAQKAAQTHEPAVFASAELFSTVVIVSPEQLEGGPIDVRTDLYALGCTLYFSLTSRFPFDGADAREIMTAHLERKLVPIGERRPDLPAGVADWLMRLISYNPADRPASAAEALQLLRAATVVRQSAPVGPASVASAPQGSARPMFTRPAFWIALAVVPAVVAMAALAISVLGPLARRLPEFVMPAIAAITSQAQAKPNNPLELPLASPSPNALPVDGAAEFKHLGMTVELQGIIESSPYPDSDTMKHLQIRSPDATRVTLIINTGNDPGAFSPDSITALLGRNVKLSGVVGIYRGAQAVMIHKLSQVTVL